MRVIGIGAGMGGLTVAYALQDVGIEVVVFDKDANAVANGGYRLALDATACAILRRHLSPERYQVLQASSVPPEINHRLTFAHHRLRALSVTTWDPSGGALTDSVAPLASSPPTAVSPAPTPTTPTARPVS